MSNLATLLRELALESTTTSPLGFLDAAAERLEELEDRVRRLELYQAAVDALRATLEGATP